MEFFEKLKILRMQSGFTQNELADKLLISPQTISNYEQGIDYPSIDTLVAMSKLFNTSLDALLSTNIIKKIYKSMLVTVGLLFVSIIIIILSLFFLRSDENAIKLNTFFLIGIYIIPFMYLFIYLLFQYNPPKRINKFYGYRTKASMKNQLTWDYSQSYFSLIFAKIAPILFGLNIVFSILIPLINQTSILITGYVIFGIHVLSLFVPIFFVEKKLRLLFCDK